MEQSNQGWASDTTGPPLALEYSLMNLHNIMGLWKQPPALGLHMFSDHVS